MYIIVGRCISLTGSRCKYYIFRESRRMKTDLVCIGGDNHTWYIILCVTACNHNIKPHALLLYAYLRWERLNQPNHSSEPCDILWYRIKRLFTIKYCLWNMIIIYYLLYSYFTMRYLHNIIIYYILMGIVIYTTIELYSKKNRPWAMSKIVCKIK